MLTERLTELTFKSGKGSHHRTHPKHCPRERLVLCHFPVFVSLFRRLTSRLTGCSVRLSVELTLRRKRTHMYLEVVEECPLSISLHRLHERRLCRLVRRSTNGVAQIHWQNPSGPVHFVKMYIGEVAERVVRSQYQGKSIVGEDVRSHFNVFRLNSMECPSSITSAPSRKQCLVARRRRMRPSLPFSTFTFGPSSSTCRPSGYSESTSGTRVRMATCMHAQSYATTRYHGVSGEHGDDPTEERDRAHVDDGVRRRRERSAELIAGAF